MVFGLAFAATAAGQGGYRVSQGTSNTADSGGNSGPVRMARISGAQGHVSWRPSDKVGWSKATTNIPLRQGAAVWVTDGGRAELQFDDGTRLRIGNGSLATLQTLYSDSQGEFTEIKLTSGLVSMTIKNKLSEYQIDTPLSSVKAYGPSKIRVGIDSQVEVACRSGECQCDSNQGKSNLHAGDYLDIQNTSTPLRITPIPPADVWDRYCDNRDATCGAPSSYVPTNVGIMSDDLDTYGTWRSDPHYGHVWYPSGCYAGWRPYHDGHWVWVDPYGWTWVGDEPWGWAPYHYGSWIHASYGWCWAPGPWHQYWSPAVVSFSSYNGAVAWCPLAPAEIVYPAALSFGFSTGNWFLSFSVGGAACYYPGGAGFCIGRPWTNGYVNRARFGFTAGVIGGAYGGRSWVGVNRFQPYYGRSAFAITRTTSAGFVGGGRFQSGTASDVAIFRRGQSFSPPAGRAPLFGPANVRPTRTSFATTRSFESARPSDAIAARPVFRAPLAAGPARASSSFGKSFAPTNRTAQVTRGTASHSGGSSRYDRFNSVSTPANRYGSGVSKYARTNPNRPASSGVSRYSRTGPTRPSHSGTSRYTRTGPSRPSSNARMINPRRIGVGAGSVGDRRYTPPRRGSLGGVNRPPGGVRRSSGDRPQGRSGGNNKRHGG